MISDSSFGRTALDCYRIGWRGNYNYTITVLSGSEDYNKKLKQWYFRKVSTHYYIKQVMSQLFTFFCSWQKRRKRERERERERERDEKKWINVGFLHTYEQFIMSLDRTLQSLLPIVKQYTENIFIFSFFCGFEFGERIIVPILRHFGKLNFTYYGKLWQPHYTYRLSTQGAGVDNKGARVEKSHVVYFGTLIYSGYRPFIYSGTHFLLRHPE